MKTILIATDKPFSVDARQATASILTDAGYSVQLLEKYKSESDLLAAIREADAVIIRSDIVNKQVLEAAGSLKLVVRAGAGYDNVDCETAKARGVAVMNTPGQNANAVAELVFGMLVYVARGHFDGATGSELKGKTLGIHAIGHVGRNVLRIAKGFDMTVLAHDPFVPSKDIAALGATPVENASELYAKSDVVSLHIPATPKTVKSIGKALASSLPKGGMLVNTARAEVIDEPGLLEVLEQRPDLRYITDIEPSDKEAFKALGKRYFCTPKKMGAQTEEANTNAATAAARQIVAFFERGDRTFVVND